MAPLPASTAINHVSLLAGRFVVKPSVGCCSSPTGLFHQGAAVGPHGKPSIGVVGMQQRGSTKSPQAAVRASGGAATFGKRSQSARPSGCFAGTIDSKQAADGFPFHRSGAFKPSCCFRPSFVGLVAVHHDHQHANGHRSIWDCRNVGLWGDKVRHDVGGNAPSSPSWNNNLLGAAGHSNLPWPAATDRVPWQLGYQRCLGRGWAGVSCQSFPQGAQGRTRLRFVPTELRRLPRLGLQDGPAPLAEETLWPELSIGVQVWV